MSGPRIYADFNGIERSPRDDSRYVIPLDTLGSVRDLANAGIRLHEGFHLTVFDASDDEEDLEGDATVFYDVKSRVWIAELDEKGYRYIPKEDRSLVMEFLCIGCRAAFPVNTQHGARPTVQECPQCGERMDAAIAPPDTAVKPM
jgi:hypothetical protein